jgi:hypothetical protein
MYGFSFFVAVVPFAAAAAPVAVMLSDSDDDDQPAAAAKKAAAATQIMLSSSDEDDDDKMEERKSKPAAAAAAAALPARSKGARHASTVSSKASSVAHTDSSDDEGIKPEEMHPEAAAILKSLQSVLGACRCARLRAPITLSFRVSCWSPLCSSFAGVLFYVVFVVRATRRSVTQHHKALAQSHANASVDVALLPAAPVAAWPPKRPRVYQPLSGSLGINRGAPAAAAAAPAVAAPVPPVVHPMIPATAAAALPPVAAIAPPAAAAAGAGSSNGSNGEGDGRIPLSLLLREVDVLGRELAPLPKDAPVASPSERPFRRSFLVFPDMRFGAIREKVQALKPPARDAGAAGHVKLVVRGREVGDEETPQSCHMQSKDVVQCFFG